MYKLIKVMLVLLLITVLSSCTYIPKSYGKGVDIIVNKYIKSIETPIIDDDIYSVKTIHEITDKKCILFRSYRELENFLTSNNLVINYYENADYKYDENFFTDKVLILFYTHASSEWFQYKFLLNKSDSLLNLRITIIPPRKAYSIEYINIMYQIVFDQNEILDITSFDYTITHKKGVL